MHEIGCYSIRTINSSKLITYRYFIYVTSPVSTLYITSVMEFEASTVKVNLTCGVHTDIYVTSMVSTLVQYEWETKLVLWKFTGRTFYFILLKNITAKKIEYWYIYRCSLFLIFAFNANIGSTLFMFIFLLFHFNKFIFERLKQV